MGHNSEANMSLEKRRLEYRPHLHDLLKQLQGALFVKAASKKRKNEAIAKYFPQTFHTSSYRLEKGKPQPSALTIGAFF